MIEGLFSTDQIMYGGDTFMLIMKAIILLSLLFYIIFSFVVVRQVNKMTDTLEVGFEAPIRFFAAAHLLLSIGVFIFGVIAL